MTEPIDSHTAPGVPSPATVYEDAPSIIREISWVLEQSTGRRFGEELGR